MGFRSSFRENPKSVLLCMPLTALIPPLAYPPLLHVVIGFMEIDAGQRKARPSFERRPRKTLRVNWDRIVICIDIISF